MLWFSSIYPFPFVAPVMFQVTKAEQEVESDGQSIPYTACFFQVPLSLITEEHPCRLPVPLGPNAFTRQISSGVSFPPCGHAWCKAASFKDALSKVTFSWKHTKAHSVSTPDMIVIQLTGASVLLVWGGKLLFSRLILPLTLIHTVTDVWMMCFHYYSALHEVQKRQRRIQWTNVRQIRLLLFKCSLGASLWARSHSNYVLPSNFKLAKLLDFHNCSNSLFG